MTRALLVAVALAGCGDGVQDPWELDHDRIIAIRADPPRIMPGEHATIDVLLGFSAHPVAERPPDLATVVSPKSLAHIVAPDAGQWVVTAPGEDALAAARAELSLAAGAPVPVQIVVGVTWPYPVASADGATFHATKTVWLGEQAANPALPAMLINGSDAPDGTIVVPKDREVPLFMHADDTVESVNWLTSCGEMHDFDLHSAYLVVTPESSQEGELAVVYRDDRGGVTWRVWPIRAE